LVLNSQKIKLIALADIELCLPEGITIILKKNHFKKITIIFKKSIVIVTHSQLVCTSLHIEKYQQQKNYTC